MTLFKYLVATIFFLSMSQQVLAQPEKDSLRVLFVGNSYTFVSNMPQLVSLISQSTKRKLITSKSTAGGADLQDHWNGSKGLRTKELIKNGSYDVVVVQGHSMETINDKSNFLKYSKKLCDLIKESGATPMLFVTWARQKVPQYQEIITNVYKQASEENSCQLVMVGEAWKLARTKRPDIPLFMLDGTHPSDLGAFLTACVFVATLSEEIPETLSSSYFVTDASGEQLELLWEDDLDIIFCQKIASNFVKVTQ